MTIKYKLGVFGDSLLDRQIRRISEFLRIPESDNFKITIEGGYAVKFINKTGALSVKGSVVEFSSTLDDSVVLATDPNAVQGVVYEDGIKDGQPVWCVIRGICDVLMRDGFGTTPNMWARLSSTTPGRIVTQNKPGYDLSPDSIVYTNGATDSGTLADLLTDNGTYLVIAETTGTPGIDAKLVYVTSELLDTINVVGHYLGNHAAGVLIQCWNFTTTAWVTKVTLPPSTTEDIGYSENGLTTDFRSGGEQWVRVYHPDPGNTAHRTWLDKLVLSGSGTQERFKEVGHTMRTVVGGTNKLARINLTIL